MARRIRRENIKSRLLHRCLDIAMNWFGLTLAYLAKEGFSLGIPSEPLTPQVVIHSFVVIAFLWLAVSSALETYSYKRPLFWESLSLVICLVVTIAFFNTYVYFVRPFKAFIVPRYVMMLYATLGSVLLIISRGTKLHIVRAMHRRGLGMVRALIVGTVPAAHRLANAFRHNPALGYRFLGFVTLPDDEDPPQNQLGTTDNLEQIVQNTDTEEIIVALPGRQHHEIQNIAQRCQSENIRLRVVPDLFEVTMIRASLSEIEDIPLIGLRDPVITGYQSLAKRIFDLVVATIMLILSIPLFIIIPLLIRLDSRGRIIFRQKRVGENGRIFDMYKFRSMVENAEEKLSELVDLEQLDQPAFKIPDDPRVTRVGRFLRRTSLDELPQLINVLKGDMSMVGPRPEELQVVQYYQLWHRRRLSIKPGITGPMQVSGRGVLNLDDRIKLELMYINRYSILEDIKYLLKTIPAVCRARGAY